MNEAFYYEIVDEETGQGILDSGIISDSESTIYPGQNNPDEDYAFPSECDAHHFFQNDTATKKAKITIVRFQISRNDILARKRLLS